MHQDDCAGDKRHEEQRYPSRPDAKKQERSAADLGCDREIGEKPGHAKRFEVLCGACRREHFDLEPRVSLAVMFYAHAWLKIKVFTPAGTAKYFESLGVPGFLAYLTIAAEIGGGTLLVLGLGTRSEER